MRYFDNYDSVGTELMLRMVSSGKDYKQVYFKVKERDGNARFGTSILANLKIFRSLFLWLFKNKKLWLLNL